MSGPERVDVAVVGLGLLGSAALYALARDGRRVVGLEQFRPGHANGSSHGRSRALRFVYHAPEYVTLVRSAVDGWRALELTSGRAIYTACGTLFFARPGNALLADNVAIMAAAGTPHERLDAAAVTRRFPAFAMTSGAEGVFNPDGGMVDPDAAGAAFRDGAMAAGGQIRGNVRVRALDGIVAGTGTAGPVRLDTTAGELLADHVIVAAGAWTNDLVPDLRLPIRVTRQAWYTMQPADPAAVAPGRIPVWCDYDTLYYGFPDHGLGLKIADDTPGRPAVPGVDQPYVEDAEERRRLTGYLRERFPTSDLALVEGQQCLYTLTPDEDFVLGPVPGSAGRVSVAVGLNHAAKFAPVIGRILADLATGGETPHPIARFRLDRFGPAGAG